MSFVTLWLSNTFLQEIAPNFLGTYLAKYYEIFGFVFQQVEENNFQVCSQELIFPFRVPSQHEKGGLALG